jgi:hypothetical protein
MKNPTEIEGNWNETKGKLKQKFEMLANGTQNELIERLRIKLRKIKDELSKLNQIITKL